MPYNFLGIFMKLVSKLLLAAVCAAAIVPAMAQEKRSSISLSGTYSKTGSQDGNANVTGSYGFMYRPNIELGVFDMLFAGSGFTMNSIGGQVQYYLNPVGRVGTWNPYGKVSLGSSMMSIDSGGKTNTSTGFSVGGAVGAANNLTESTELFIEVGATSNSYSGTTETGTAANIGLKIRF
jgi:hypothetical protein